MANLQKKSINTPDETRSFEHGKFEILNIDGYTIGKATLEPGWKWSTSVKPIVKTDSCQSNHFIYMLTGRLKVVMNDGTETEVGANETVHVPPGHDAWVV